MHQQTPFEARSKVLLGLFVLGFTISFVTNGCAGNLKAGYRAIVIVAQARDETSKTLAEVCGKKRKECKVKAKIKTEEYKTCMAKCVKVLEQWIKHVKPTINSALWATYAALEVAAVKKEKNTDWLKSLKPAVCALSKALKEWKDLIGDKAVLTAIDFMEVASCQ